MVRASGKVGLVASYIEDLALGGGSVSLVGLVEGGGYGRGTLIAT